MTVKTQLKSLAVCLLATLAVGCTSGNDVLGEQGLSGLPTGDSAPPPTIASDTGAQEFLARSGFLGFASINDRAIGQNRFLAYHSRSDLLPEDSNGIDDIYLKDTKLGTTILVSKASDGTQGNGASTQASISADGRFVVYRSAASNLVAGDTNGTEDIFMYDVLTGMTSRVSVGAGASESNGTSLTPAVSNGGQYVVFASEAANLVGTDTNAQPDIFVRDTVNNTTSLISSNSALLDSANGGSFDPAISPDGAFLTFSTESTNILAAALNGTRQVVRIERATPTNRVLVSQTGSTQANGPCYEPTISNDGNVIAFFTNATNLATDTNGLFDVYVRNISGDTTTRSSVDSGGGESDGHSGFPSISGDGSIVTFGSLATDLVTGDNNGVFDVFSRTGSTTTRVSVDTSSTEANVDSDLPAVSLDGRYVAFRSAASNLDGNDTTFDDDIFMRDITTPSTVLHSIACRIPAAFGGFSVASNFPAGNCFTIVPADFNGDGNLDVAATDQSMARVSLQLGDGLGGLGAATFFPVAAILGRGLTAGDFDKDGNLDLVSTHFFADNGSILLGDGAGGFSAPSNFALGDGPLTVKNGDFDEDGNLDIVVVNELDDNVSILLGSGAGTFAAATSFAAGDAPRSLVVADFNNDGNLDVAVTNSSDNNVSVLLGDGTGSLSAATNFAVGAVPHGISTGDFNKDGNPDIVVTNTADDNISVLLGNGAGSFSAALNLAVGDFPFYVAVDDLDGDGNQDIVTSDAGTDTVSILLGDGSGSFSAAPSLSTPPGSFAFIETGDFDNDGHVDIAGGIADTSSVVSIFLNQRPAWPGFAPQIDFPLMSSPAELSLGDLDGDGDLDLAIRNGSNDRVSVRFNDGAGNFSGNTELPAVVQLTHSQLVDTNSDGHLDILTIDSSADVLSIFTNDGLGTFSVPTNITLSSISTGTSFAATDFNGDGHTDLAVAESTAAQISVFLNDGTGAFPSSTPLTSAAISPKEIASGDLDGDGDRDIIYNDNSGLDVYVRLNNGSGSFGAETSFNAGGAGQIRLADIDKDGDLDAVIQSSSSLSIAHNDGAGSFPALTSIFVGSSVRSVEIGDLDGDGDVDLVVSRGSSNFISVLIGDGSGGFAPPIDIPAGSTPLDGDLGDVDGDGDLDLCIPNLSGDNISVFLNQACP